MKKKNHLYIDPNKCKKKLVEYCNQQLKDNWLDKSKKKWKRDKEKYKTLLDCSDTTYLDYGYRYARVVAGYLVPKSIPECLRVNCVVDCYHILNDKDTKSMDIPIKSKQVNGIKLNINKKKRKPTKKKVKLTKKKSRRK